jgi:hypothetical protein
MIYDIYDDAFMMHMRCISLLNIIGVTGWPSKSQLIRGFVQKSTEKDVTGHMAGNVDCFDPKMPESYAHQASY